MAKRNKDGEDDKLENPGRRFWARKPAAVAEPAPPETTSPPQEPFMPRLEKSIVVTRRLVMGGLAATSVLGGAISSAPVVSQVSGAATSVSDAELAAKLKSLWDAKMQLMSNVRMSTQHWRGIRDVANTISQTSRASISHQVHLADMASRLKAAPNLSGMEEARQAILTLQQELAPHAARAQAMISEGLIKFPTNSPYLTGLDKHMVRELTLSPQKQAMALARTTRLAPINAQSAQNAVAASQRYVASLTSTQQKFIARRLAHGIKKGEQTTSFEIEQSDSDNYFKALVGAHTEFRDCTKEIKRIARCVETLSHSDANEPHPLARLQYYVLSMDALAARLQQALQHIEIFENALKPYQAALSEQYGASTEVDHLPVSKSHLDYIISRLGMDEQTRSDDISRLKSTHLTPVLEAQEAYKARREKLITSDDTLEPIIVQQEEMVEQFWQVAHEPKWAMAPVYATDVTSKVVGVSFKAQCRSGLSVDREISQAQLNARLEKKMPDLEIDTSDPNITIVRPNNSSPMSTVIHAALQGERLQQLIQSSAAAK